MREIVLVSGRPGAGKSTLAVPLATALGLPLIAKDVIKEQLHDTLAPLLMPEDPMLWSKALGAASMEVLWRLADLSPAMVLEANFRPHSEYERARLVGFDARIVEVYCECGPDEAARRSADRRKRGERHPTHAGRDTTVAQTEWDRPVGLGFVIEVDTRRPVDVQGVAQRVRAALKGDGVRTAAN